MLFRSKNILRKIKEVVNMFNKVNSPKILFFGDNVPYNDISRFYTASDCYILCSRGEGIGLPYAEAMACGRPVIATGWGGHTDFVNETNGFLINYVLKLIDDQSYILKCINALGHQWAIPSIDDIRQKMRFVYEFPDIAKAKGLKARADMEQRTWQKAGLWTINRILELNK